MVEERFCGPSLKHDAAKLAIQCQTCQLAKSKKNIGLYMPISISHKLLARSKHGLCSWIAKKNSKA
jgi:hypothetical protein